MSDLRAVSVISRRAFGRMTAGAGMLGTVGLSEGCGKPGADHGRPTGPPPLAAKGVGVVLSHEQFRTDQLVAQARAAEEAGFQYVWASDHIQPWQDNEGHSMFPWLTLALVGNSTRVSHGNIEWPSLSCQGWMWSLAHTY